VEYWISRDEQRYGPYSESELKQWLLTGDLDLDDLVWYEELDLWITLRTLFGLDRATEKPSANETPSASDSTRSAEKMTSGSNATIENGPAPRTEPKGTSIARKLPVIEIVLLLGVGFLTIVGIALFSSHTSQTGATTATTPATVAANTSAIFPSATRTAAPPAPIVPEMTEHEILRCENYAHIAMEVAGAKARFEGVEYATQQALKDIQAHTSQGCVDRIIREAKESQSNTE
jgi:hypothetical protein